jgi:hypothetical protein
MVHGSFVHVLLVFGHVWEWNLFQLGLFLEGVHVTGNVRKFS